MTDWHPNTHPKLKETHPTAQAGIFREEEYGRQWRSLRIKELKRKQDRQTREIRSSLGGRPSSLDSEVLERLAVSELTLRDLEFFTKKKRTTLNASLGRLISSGEVVACGRIGRAHLYRVVKK